MIKYFIQLELGRQCLLYDDTTITQLNRVPGLRFGNASWSAWLCLIGYASVFLSLIGILGSVGGLLASVAPFASYKVWCVVVFALVVVLLWRGIYQDLEKMVTVLVALFSLVVIGSLLFFSVRPTRFRLAIWRRVSRSTCRLRALLSLWP